LLIHTCEVAKVGDGPSPYTGFDERSERCSWNRGTNNSLNSGWLVCSTRTTSTRKHQHTGSEDILALSLVRTKNEMKEMPSPNSLRR
jgi:hypothetical protein